MNKFNIFGISSGDAFSEALTLEDPDYLVAAPGIPLQRKLKDALSDWRFEDLYSEGTILSQDKSIHEKIAYNQFLDWTLGILNDLAEDKDPDYDLIAEKIQNLVQNLKEDPSKILLACEEDLNENESAIQNLAVHSTISCILSILIGIQFKLSDERLEELGIAGLLHEAGMLKLPTEVYYSNLSLSPVNRKHLLAHPVLGYKLLKSFKFPEAVCAPALEHHERENGQGYPRGVGSNKINLYSKIVAVACSYEAFNSKKPYKDEVRQATRGILEILRNEGKAYDDRIVRALVQALSIYPIGSFVMLSNGSPAQVIRSIPNEPKFPQVAVIKNGKQSDEIITRADGIYIIGAISRQEAMA
ncbi:MAG: HD domain-containing protein [Spirochaetaceae bacterium]|jgi:HD-GYP domain-containing protein (c-di-GMP phosphodiesterase class II)|nr:HD domain-containing protein [Spirochaetaceae bacterium]